MKTFCLLLDLFRTSKLCNDSPSAKRLKRKSQYYCISHSAYSSFSCICYLKCYKMVANCSC
uniref:Uncharacterized protein n=1 Tax=Oryzias latipes TaxID=8090 RepID=A0A3P9IIM7_ORYLA